MSEVWEVVAGRYQTELAARKRAKILHRSGYFGVDVRKVNPDAHPE